MRRRLQPPRDRAEKDRRGLARPRARPGHRQDAHQPCQVCLRRRGWRQPAAAAEGAHPRGQGVWVASPSAGNGSSATTRKSWPSTGPRFTASRWRPRRPWPCRTWIPASSKASRPSFAGRSPREPLSSSTAKADTPTCRSPAGPTTHLPSPTWASATSTWCATSSSRARRAGHDRLDVLHVFYPAAKASDWRLINAGIRVQAIKKTNGKAGYRA